MSSGPTLSVPAHYGNKHTRPVETCFMTYVISTYVISTYVISTYVISTYVISTKIKLSSSLGAIH